MGALFTVVHQVPHIDEESRVRVSFGGGLGQLFPAAVVAGLGVGKNQTFKAAAPVGGKGPGLTAVTIVNYGVLVEGTGVKAGKARGVYIVGFPIVGKTLLRHRKAGFLT